MPRCLHWPETNSPLGGCLHLVHGVHGPWGVVPTETRGAACTQPTEYTACGVLQARGPGVLLAHGPRMLPTHDLGCCLHTGWQCLYTPRGPHGDSGLPLQGQSGSLGLLSCLITVRTGQRAMVVSPRVRAPQVVLRAPRAHRGHFQSHAGELTPGLSQ